MSRQIQLASLLAKNELGEKVFLSCGLFDFLFDINWLWGEYILVRLKQVQDEKGFQLRGQQSKVFCNAVTIRPDITIAKRIGEDKQTFVIDAKWKDISRS
jgi:5-methylcytosine-specific restriction enzyme subunit McrC